MALTMPLAKPVGLPAVQLAVRLAVQLARGRPRRAPPAEVVVGCAHAQAVAACEGEESAHRPARDRRRVPELVRVEVVEREARAGRGRERERLVGEPNGHGRILLAAGRRVEEIERRGRDAGERLDAARGHGHRAARAVREDPGPEPAREHGLGRGKPALARAASSAGAPAGAATLIRADATAVRCSAACGDGARNRRWSKGRLRSRPTATRSACR